MPNQETTKLEIKVKPLERYVVTKYTGTEDSGSVSEIGTYTSPHIAFEVAYAMCRQEHERLGWPPADERIQYPRHPLGDEHDKAFAENGIIVRDT